MSETREAGESPRAKATRAERKAINRMFAAYNDLLALGWRASMYAPRDGSPIEVIEIASTGIHRGYRDDISFWIRDGETWPSSPVLFRLATLTDPHS